MSFVILYPDAEAKKKKIELMNARVEQNTQKKVDKMVRRNRTREAIFEVKIHIVAIFVQYCISLL